MLACVDFQRLSSNLIGDFYSANNRQIKLQKLNEPSTDDPKQDQIMMNLMDVQWKDIKVVKKVSKTYLFS